MQKESAQSELPRINYDFCKISTEVENGSNSLLSKQYGRLYALF
jgi:hypothetical protein